MPNQYPFAVPLLALALWLSGCATRAPSTPPPPLATAGDRLPTPSADQGVVLLRLIVNGPGLSADVQLPDRIVIAKADQRRVLPRLRRDSANLGLYGAAVEPGTWQPVELRALRRIDGARVRHVAPIPGSLGRFDVKRATLTAPASIVYQPLADSRYLLVHLADGADVAALAPALGSNLGGDALDWRPGGQDSAQREWLTSLNDGGYPVVLEELADGTYRVRTALGTTLIVRNREVVERSAAAFSTPTGVTPDSTRPLVLARVTDAGGQWLLTRRRHSSIVEISDGSRSRLAFDPRLNLWPRGIQRRSDGLVLIAQLPKRDGARLVWDPIPRVVRYDPVADTLAVIGTPEPGCADLPSGNFSQAVYLRCEDGRLLALKPGSAVGTLIYTPSSAPRG